MFVDQVVNQIFIVTLKHVHHNRVYLFRTGFTFGFYHLSAAVNLIQSIVILPSNSYSIISRDCSSEDKAMSTIVYLWGYLSVTVIGHRRNYHRRGK